MNRRQFLAGTTVFPGMVFAGCVSSVFSTDQPSLNCLELTNLHDEPHTVHVRVDFDGDEVIATAYQLDAKQDSGPVPHTWVTPTWPDHPGHFRIHARLDDETEWKAFDSEGREGDFSFAVMYRIDTDGYGAFWRSVTAADDRGSQCDNAPTADGIDSVS